MLYTNQILGKFVAIDLPELEGPDGLWFAYRARMNIIESFVNSFDHVLTQNDVLIIRSFQKAINKMDKKEDWASSNDSEIYTSVLEWTQHYINKQLEKKLETNYWAQLNTGK
jgi:hypothetical protein